MATEPQVLHRGATIPTWSRTAPARPSRPLCAVVWVAVFCQYAVPASNFHPDVARVSARSSSGRVVQCCGDQPDWLPSLSIARTEKHTVSPKASGLDAAVDVR